MVDRIWNSAAYRAMIIYHLCPKIIAPTKRQSKNSARFCIPILRYLAKQFSEKYDNHEHVIIFRM